MTEVWSIQCVGKQKLPDSRVLIALLRDPRSMLIDCLSKIAHGHFFVAEKEIYLPHRIIKIGSAHASHERGGFKGQREQFPVLSHDLRAFKARGGKMLLWHGLADGGIMATSSIGYYEGVIKLMGGRKQTENLFRMFLIPGVHHCGGGPGLTEFDALTLLENWVENGKAPEVLMTARRVDDGVERSRPVYPYPILARYSGTGDPKQAASFVPTDSGGR